MSIHHLLRICRLSSDFPSPTVRTIHQIINQGNNQVPCTFRPASTWILAPVMLVFLANMMNASAPVQRQQIAPIQNLSSRKGLQSCKSVSCFSTAVSIANWILSSEYFLPCTTESAQDLIPRSSSRGKQGIVGKRTHSVRSSPGSTVFTRILGPCVAPRHLMRCSCAALVTEYGMEDPAWDTAAIEPVEMKTPPSGLVSKVGFAALRRASGALTLADQHCGWGISMHVEAGE
jgi:hypothetical protein